jgi:hypothetical protein
MTLFFSADMTSPGSAAPNMELPATMQLAPAEAAASIVEGPRPPSTWKHNHKLVLRNWKCWKWLPKSISGFKAEYADIDVYLDVKGWVLLSQRMDLIYPDLRKWAELYSIRNIGWKNPRNRMKQQQPAIPSPSFLAWISDHQSQAQLSSQEPFVPDFLLPPVKFLINKSRELLMSAKIFHWQQPTKVKKLNIWKNGRQERSASNSEDIQ